jgi:hypothetical protein
MTEQFPHIKRAVEAHCIAAEMVALNPHVRSETAEVLRHVVVETVAAHLAHPDATAREMMLNLLAIARQAAPDSLIVRYGPLRD